MNGSKRLVINTSAQYIKTIINLVLALYSTRLILEALGSLDYGLYSVIAGVVSMLSFVNNSLVISTQRHLSFLKGKGDMLESRHFFANSFFIHIILGLFIFGVLFLSQKILVEQILNIPIQRQSAASVVFVCVGVIISLTFVTSSFRAIFISRENIVFISVIDILDAIFKLLIAVILLDSNTDKLILYGLLLLGISVFNLLAFGIYAYKYYEEFCWPKRDIINLKHIKKITSFAGWTLFSTGCVIGRTQGLAMLFNVFYGVLINTAYGIAQQISGAVMNVSQAIANAMSPQIIKAEGSGDRNRMLYMASLECLFSYAMLSVFAIPLIIKMPLVLEFWLVEVPDYAVLFCRFILISCLFDQITGGLGIANQASGNIKNYSIIFGLLKILTLPICYYLIKKGYDVSYSLTCFALIELLASLLRIFFLNKSAGLVIGRFLRRVIVPIVCSTLLSFFVCYKVGSLFYESLLSLVVILFFNVLIVILVILVTIRQEDRCKIINVVKGLTKGLI